MDNQKALDKVVEAIKNSNNVLVTINRNPDVDQIAAAIALSFVLEKLEKFTTTIFSGPIPAAAEFLDPEKTFSSNMETLRDFVISIHKDKVDRLRYKQEGDQVRVYLTPYRTTLSQADLEFENGDYNIDLVITIGTVTQEDMDSAIVGAIRILHDATVISINTGGTVPSYANISWADPEEIAYCEMVADLAEILGESEIDEHTATALLTGIVAATDQFKNIKANPKVMQLAAKLMSFGANQQLISIKLEEGTKIDQQQNSAQAPAPTAPQVLDDSQVAHNINQDVEATTNAVQVINNELAKNHAESVYEQIQPQPALAPEPAPQAPLAPPFEPVSLTPISEPAPLAPTPSPEPTPSAPTPTPEPIPPAPITEPTLPEPAPGLTPESTPEPMPASTLEPTPEPTIPPASLQPSPAPEPTPVQPTVPPTTVEPLTPPLPEPPGNVMTDLASYAPPALQQPELPPLPPSPGLFPASTEGNLSSSLPPFAPPVPSVPSEPPTPPTTPQDITSRAFMTHNPDLDNVGEPSPSAATSSEPESPAASPSDLADLSSIAAKVGPEELGEGYGSASFDVNQALGVSQSSDPFASLGTSIVTNPAAELQQQPDVLPPQPPAEIPNNQFKIPGQ
jgi:hypothetical protein